ncbi:MAG: hypothetical protein ACYC23_20110 [Limisphaerales bacterium]
MDCCNSSGPRALGLASTFLGTRHGGGFRIHTFSPARWDVTLAGVPVGLVLESRFPSDGLGSIQVNPEREVEFELGIRIPRWSRDARVTMVDRSFEAKPGTYLQIRRVWRRGDVVQFSFPFVPTVQVGTGSNEGRVAVTAGPLVLALDQADNRNIHTPRQVALASVAAEELDFRSRPALGNRSWADQVLWECNLIDLAAVAPGRDGHFRGLLRPFLDAGSWDGTQFAVWLGAPSGVPRKSSR